MPAKRIGVIDVGSNSIKLLVAERGKDTPLSVIRMSIQEKRIGEGITGTPPTIDHDAIERGAIAIAALSAEAEEDQVDELRIVATSAVRDAANQDAFIKRIQTLSGHKLQVLTGEEEAHYIAQGVHCDPALKTLSDFFLVDLGGGSMECIHHKENKVIAAQSFQLGAVRLTSKLVADREAPLAPDEATQIRNHVRQTLEASHLKPSQAAVIPLVLTGGAARLISYHFTEEQCARGISPKNFHRASKKVSYASKSDRIALYNIPPSRADVFPAALQTLEETVDYLNAAPIYFTSCNLRFGLAHTLLD